MEYLMHTVTLDQSKQYIWNIVKIYTYWIVVKELVIIMW